MGETGRVSRLSGTRGYGHATKLVVTGMVLAWTAAGCSSPSPVTGGSVTSCYQFAARAIQRHVTVAVFVIAAHITAACITILLATLAAIGAG